MNWQMLVPAMFLLMFKRIIAGVLILAVVWGA
jgi:hypothetical protein